MDSPAARRARHGLWPLRLGLVAGLLATVAGPLGAEENATRVAAGLPPSPPESSIVDRAAVFRTQPELAADITAELAALAQQTGVRVYLVTLAFLADRSPQAEARQVAEAWSPDQPAAAIVFVRGSGQAGIGTNSRLDARVPDFEVAAIAPAGSATGGDSEAEQLQLAVGELAALIRRYQDAGSAEPSEGSDRTRATKLTLLAFVLLAATGIVGVTAWSSRRPIRPPDS